MDSSAAVNHLVCRVPQEDRQHEVYLGDEGGIARAQVDHRGARKPGAPDASDLF